MDDCKCANDREFRVRPRPTADAALLTLPERCRTAAVGVGCGYSLHAAGRQHCAVHLTLKAQRRRCEWLPSLDTVNSQAAPGKKRPVTSGGFAVGWCVPLDH